MSKVHKEECGCEGECESKSDNWWVVAFLGFLLIVNAEGCISAYQKGETRVACYKALEAKMKAVDNQKVLVALDRPKCEAL